MCSQRQGIRSPQSAILPSNNTVDGQVAPGMLKQQSVIMTVYNVKRTLFTDQTGKFPKTSSRGNTHQMALHAINSNTIWVEPMPNRTEHAMIAAQERAVKRMRAAGFDTFHEILDNEASAKYEEVIKKLGMTYQLIPLDDHRRNIAEKAIQFWNDNFVAVLSGTATTFTFPVWCQAIP